MAWGMLAPKHSQTIHMKSSDDHFISDAFKKRVSERRLMESLSEPDKQMGVVQAAERRVAERLSYYEDVVLLDPHTHIIRCIGRARNISANGVAVLHASYIEPDTPCVVGLKRLDGAMLRVNGRVVQCSEMCGELYDIGVQFERAITLADFARSNVPDEKTGY